MTSAGTMKQEESESWWKQDEDVRGVNQKGNWSRINDGDRRKVNHQPDEERSRSDGQRREGGGGREREKEGGQEGE